MSSTFHHDPSQLQPDHPTPVLEPAGDSFGFAVPSVLRTIPGYRVIRELGRGGMGVVYEAHDLRLDRLVALKLVVEGTISRRSAARLRGEGVAAARLNHPNLVQIYEVGEVDGNPYLVLELVRGEPLTARLSRGILEPSEAIRLLRTLALAVEHAHQRGVVHRDLKPANVLLAEAGEAKIADFGLARLLDRDLGKTASGTVVGTPHYMAPETIAEGSRAAGPAADVYALGVILYECLTGRTPFEGRTGWEVMRRVADDDPVPPSRLRTGLPRSLDAICLTALAKNLDRRYSSSAEFAADLDRVAAGEPVRARSGRLTRRAQRVGWRLAVVALVLAVAGSGWFWRPVGVAADPLREAEACEQTGLRLLERGEFAAARAEFDRGLEVARNSPHPGDLTERFLRGQKLCERGRIADELHRIVDRLRFGFEPGSLTMQNLRQISDLATTLWSVRGRLVSPEPGVELPTGIEGRLREDLRDLALFSAELLTRIGRHPEAATRLDEAERSLGNHPLLDFSKELQRFRAVGGSHPVPPTLAATATSRELYTLGRMLVDAEQYESATVVLRRSVGKEPGAFWPQFLLGSLALRQGRPTEAVAGFAAALAVAQEHRGRVAYHLGLAHAAAGDLEAAIIQFDQALEREPRLSAAALNRGLARLRQNRPAEAIRDFELARKLGHSPGVVAYHLALALEATGNRPAALAAAREAVAVDGSLVPARRLVRNLEGGQ